MAKFHNPYHFVPVKRLDRAKDLQRKEFPGGEVKAVRHDRYMPDTHSGRIVCRLETETPLVLGGERKRREKQTALACPFELDDRPAIPGSSLRGMITSIAEAASGSALRVLEKRPLTYRKPMDKSLSAIGKVEKADGGYQLIPLTLPTMKQIKGTDFAKPVDGADWTKLFPNKANLKVYFGNRHSINATTLRSSTKIFRGAFMELQDPSPLFLNAKGELYVDKACHVKNGNVLSQNPAPKQLEPTVSDSSKNTKGVVRVLGIAGRDIPSGKHHELFIPMNFGTQIPIPSAVVDDFHAMADERTAESTRWGADNVPPNKVLPYHPIDTPRNDKKEDKLPDWDVDKLCFRLKAGDLVYFRPNKEGTAVEEIALSAIWRGKADADTHGFFGEIDEELLPFHRKRKTITPAEALFGFVEEVEEKQKKPRDPAQKPGLALASRVRFSAGMYAGDPANAYLVQQGREQTLKILGQPKPPCPSLYFKHRGNGVGAISKTGLSKGLHEPQGRKMYLHHRAEEIKAQCWITSKPTEQTQLKTAVRPVNALRSYHFHLDFDNLTNAELGLLLYSLRPNDEFRHKLGMGKSLGLGTVRVDVAGVFLVDRISRYSSGSVLSPKRFTWVCDFKPNLLDGLAAESYQREIGEARGAESKDLSSLRFLKDEKACRVLESIGNPTKMSVPVKPPISPNQNDPERETFRWFVENQQQLVPVNPDSDTLPKLSS